MHTYEMTYKKSVLGLFSTETNLKEYDLTFFKFVFASYKNNEEKLEFISVPINTAHNGDIYLNLNALPTRQLDLLLTHPSIDRLDGR